MASLNKLAVVFSGATGNNSDMVNGIFLFQGIKDDKPFYKNLVSQRYCYCATDGRWYVHVKANFDTSKAAGVCSTIEAGYVHPSRASRWQMGVNGKWEEQPAITVQTMVSLIKETTRFLKVILLLLLLLVHVCGKRLF